LSVLVWPLAMLLLIAVAVGVFTTLEDIAPGMAA